MGKITEHLADIARRGGDLSPLGEPVRRVLWEGNRERALAGEDAQGRRYDSLSPATLKRRKGSGPPLAPRGAASRIVTGYVVSVIAAMSRLTFTGSWPGLDWVQYHADGTKRMPRRDPFGFRQRDLDKVRTMVREYIMKDGR